MIRPEKQKIKYIVVNYVDNKYPDITQYYVVDEKKRNLPAINAIADFVIDREYQTKQQRDLIARGIAAFVNEVNK